MREPLPWHLLLALTHASSPQHKSCQTHYGAWRTSSGTMRVWSGCWQVHLSSASVAARRRTCRMSCGPY